MYNIIASGFTDPALELIVDQQLRGYPNEPGNTELINYLNAVIPQLQISDRLLRTCQIQGGFTPSGGTLTITLSS